MPYPSGWTSDDWIRSQVAQGRAYGQTVSTGNPDEAPAVVVAPRAPSATPAVAIASSAPAAGPSAGIQSAAFPDFADVRGGASRGLPAGDVRNGFSIDRSRGTSGLDWAQTHTPGDREVVRAPSTGPHTQGELEGMANAKRLIEQAYGPTGEDFDPVRAQTEALEGQAKLRIAEQRAEDPLAFARMQAEIPARAQTDARIGGGLRLAKEFGGFDQQLQALEQKRAAMHALESYQKATPEARAAADARLDAEKTRVSTSLRVLQQAMGFATGQTPGSLYAEQYGG